jgi:uncharacterized protein DUF6602
MGVPNWVSWPQIVDAVTHTPAMSDKQNAPRGFNPAADLRFHRILVAVEQELQTALNRARSESSHGTSIGDGAEDAVRNMLRTYLPSNYGVGNGHVYDAFGDCSCESDVVITNPDHPMSFPTGKRGTYVAAAGEVKAVLDLTKLDDCVKKGAAFKQLRMTVNDSDRVLTPNDTAYMKQLGLVPPFFVCRDGLTPRVDARMAQHCNAANLPRRVGVCALPHPTSQTPDIHDLTRTRRDLGPCRRSQL